MRAWVYHSQRRTAEAAEFVERLRASGDFGVVTPANTRYYEGEVHAGDTVFHDGSSRRLVWAHDEAGVPVQLWTEPDLNQEAPRASVSPEPAQPTPAPDQSAEAAEQVRQNGTWFTAYRGGEKVGPSQRSEEDAWALLRGGADA